MKKFLTIIILGCLFNTNTHATSFDLTCTSDDGSLTDTIQSIGEKKAILRLLNDRFLSFADLAISPGSYTLTGDYADGVAKYRITINRTTGRFSKYQIFAGTNETSNTVGICTKIKNKF